MLRNLHQNDQMRTLSASASHFYVVFSEKKCEQDFITQFHALLTITNVDSEVSKIGDLNDGNN